MIGIHTVGHRNIIVENNQEKGEDNNDISSTNVTSVDISNGNISADNANCGVYTSNNNGTESVGIRQLMVVSVTLTRDSSLIGMVRKLCSVGECSGSYN